MPLRNTSNLQEPNQMNDMLCRVADSLFWMSRYIERAENIARLADVNLQLLLDLDKTAPEAEASIWEPLMTALGDRSLFDDLYDSLTSENVINFLIFNRDNQSSIASCIFSARENARMVRDQISAEMWEIVNRLYHHIRRSTHFKVGNSQLYELLQQIREYSHLFVGITESTFPRKIGYEFIVAGRCLERVEKSCRMLNSCPFLDEGDPGFTDTLIRWGAILRATSATAVYQQEYRMNFNPSNILTLLIFSRDFPRSVLFALIQLQLAVHSVSKCPVTHYSNETERLCGRLISEITYTSIAEVKNFGVPEFLLRIRKATEQIALELSSQYMFFPVVDPASDVD